MTEPVFTSTEPLTEDAVSVALLAHGVGRTLICGDQGLWMVAQRVVGIGYKAVLGGGREVIAVGASELVKLDESLGAGVWGLR